MDMWAGGAEVREPILARLRAEGRIRDMTVDMRTRGGEVRTCNYSSDVIEIGGGSMSSGSRATSRVARGTAAG